MDTASSATGSKTGSLSPKGFHFKLQTLLQLRTRYFEQVQLEFAQHQQHWATLTQTKAAITQRLTDLLNPDVETQQENPLLYQQQFGYTQLLRRQIEHLTLEIAQAERVLDYSREQLRQAHIHKQSLERLKEKQLKAFQKESEHKQAQALDDLLMMRYKSPR